MSRLLTIAAALLLLLPAAATAQANPEPQASLPDIEDEVMCTICGTALQLSDSPQAERERAFINDLIGEGEDQGRDQGRPRRRGRPWPSSPSPTARAST